MNDRKQIDIYKAILRLDGIDEPFDEFGPDHPKIGDFVNPSDYFSDDFTYKLERPGSSNLTREEVQSSYWECVGIRHTEYHMFMRFRSVDKINGRRRFLTYKDPWKFTAEIVDMPEKAKLIIRYKNGEFTLLELLKIFKEKRYSSRICFKSILLDISGDEYLQAMTELLEENWKDMENKKN